MYFERQGLRFGAGLACRAAGVLCLPERTQAGNNILFNDDLDLLAIEHLQKNERCGKSIRSAINILW